MGTTLENGVYLPSEGERNCYAGLKTNWEILDQKVADVTALQQAVAGALHRQIVTQLPTEDIDPNTIYMILSGTSATENVYNEFMYVNNAWELIGTSATDLTNYYTKAEVDGKLLLKANASDLTSHTGDTTIHVTASDKAKWNNQTYVFRYSSTALTESSTNSNTFLDNTDNLKVGDKVIDSSGVLFSITAIDTQNSTFTIGTALIDLAQDSDVVHKSGNETIAGAKTFLDVPISFKSSTAELGVTGGNTKVIFTDKNLLNLAGITFGNYGSSKLSYCRFHIYDKDSNNQEIENFLEFSYVNNNQVAYFRPNRSNFATLGTVSNRWSKVYANEYYYGSNNVEFSNKFVTTDTAQTVSGAKTFSDNLIIYNSDTTASAPSLIFKNAKAERGGNIADSQLIYFTDKLTRSLATIRCQVGSNGQSLLVFRTDNIGSDNDNIYSGFSIISYKDGIKAVSPYSDGNISLGTGNSRWSSVQTNKVNGLEPSSLSLPSGNLNDIIDISSYITDFSGTANTYTAPANGWIAISINNCMGIQAYITGFFGDSRTRQTAGTIKFLMPICKNQTINLQVYGGSTENARFIPCQGNV